VLLVHSPLIPALSLKDSTAKSLLATEHTEITEKNPRKTQGKLKRCMRTVAKFEFFRQVLKGRWGLTVLLAMKASLAPASHRELGQAFSAQSPLAQFQSERH
jgi:hypothetical protein